MMGTCGRACLWVRTVSGLDRAAKLKNWKSSREHSQVPIGEFYLKSNEHVWTQLRGKRDELFSCRSSIAKIFQWRESVAGWAATPTTQRCKCL